MGRTVPIACTVRRGVTAACRWKVTQGPHRTSRETEPERPRIYVNPGVGGGTYDNARSEWECTCGNTPEQQGFHPCTAAGVPDDEAGGRNAVCAEASFYRCDRCGVIVDEDGYIQEPAADLRVL